MTYHLIEDSLPPVAADTLPLYYRESFFTGDSLLHPELTGGRPGVAGEPVPYSVASDDAVAAMLLAGFVVAVVTVAHTRQHIAGQLKDFFYLPRTDNAPAEGGSSRLFNTVLSLLTCLLLAITTYFYVTTEAAPDFTPDTPSLVIAIYTGVFIAYFTAKTTLYKCVNSIFFGSKKSQQWTAAFGVITAAEGVALAPAVVLLVYQSLPLQSVAYYLTLVLLFTKFLTFYKAWTIFFRQNDVFLQIILYLCALEITPLLSVTGILGLMTDQFKVIF